MNFESKQWVTGSPQIRLTVTDTGDETTAILSYSLYYIATTAASSRTPKSYSVVINNKTVKSGSYTVGGKTGTNLIASGTVSIGRAKTTQSIPCKATLDIGLSWSGSYKETITASGNFSVSVLPSYSVKFNANGGSGAPGAQTKWHGLNLLLPSSKPSRTGYTFAKWLSDTRSVSYQPGNYYGYDEDATLVAQWTANKYTVVYNANGGSGAPSSQTKTHGTTLVLSSTKPTRSGYTFKGWSTSKNATTATYQPGGNYTANADVALYAVWGEAYKPPSVSIDDVYPCNASGTKTLGGEYLYVKFTYACTAVPSTNVIESVDVRCDLTNGQHSVGIGYAFKNASGTFDEVIDANLQENVMYEVTIRATDTVGNTATHKLTFFNGEFPLHIGNRAIGIGCAPGAAGTAKVAYDLYDKHGEQIRNGLVAYTGSGDASIDADSTLESEFLSNLNTPTNVFWYVQQMFYGEKSATANRCQFAFPYNSENVMWYRHYINGAWTAWKGGQKLLWGGSWYMSATHTVTLSEAISKQENGIVLVFSYFNGEAVEDAGFNSFFVSKQEVAFYPGKPHTFLLGLNAAFATVGAKYLYINDTTITGHASNTSTGTGASGIKFTNSAFVLRAVIGV